MKNTVAKPTLQEYDRMLRNHDWNYEYSDDKTKWKAGSNERARLLEISHISDSYRAMFQAYMNKLI